MSERLNLVVDRSYRLPDGVEDLPYIQVFDLSGSGVANGSARAERVPVPMPRLVQGTFVIRAIKGRDRVCSRIQIRLGERTLSSHDRGWVMPPCWMVAPEMAIGGPDLVTVDLYAVSFAYRNDASATVYTPHLVFQGCLFLPATGSRASFHEKGKPGQHMPWIYSMDLDVDWDYSDARPRELHLEIRQFDFVWYAIGLVRRGDWVPPSAELAFLFYDYRGTKLSSEPVLDVFLNHLSSGSDREYYSAFPVPALIYPAGSILRFDLRSLLLPSETPRSYTLYFYGLRVRR